ncbi:MAG: phage tail protein [Roseibium sp.]
MLYMIGAIQIDTVPLSIETASRSHGADFATKPVLNGLKDMEFMGEGDDVLTLRGQILPTKIGGTAELESVREHMTKGAALPVMRGEGTRLGSFVITSLKETHRELLRGGVPFILRHSITLKKVPAQSETGRQTIPALLKLFDLLG